MSDPVIGSEWRHRKRGHTVVVAGFGYQLDVRMVRYRTRASMHAIRASAFAETYEPVAASSPAPSGLQEPTE